MKVLLTCPPMITQLDNLRDELNKYNIEIDVPNFTALMKEDDLYEIIHKYDGWIIGDDPCTEKIIKKGSEGKLKGLVKWGVGVDNIDFEACQKYNIPISNTPGLFGEEVSDIALNYLLTLTRETHIINEKVRNGIWYKPPGHSLINKKVALIGFGDVGKCIARKCLCFGLNVYVNDPAYYRDNYNNNIICTENNEICHKICQETFKNVHMSNNIKECIHNTDYIIIACSLNKDTNKLINKDNILLANKGVHIINVARGDIVVEKDIIELLKSNFIKSVALDVFEEEPLKKNNELLKFEQNIYGTHNASNTIEAVLKASIIAIEKLKINIDKF
jgi:D-3-phosphoglycerate dehydrogenase / 2-oxoglutarate reductase